MRDDDFLDSLINDDEDDELSFEERFGRPNPSNTPYYEEGDEYIEDEYVDEDYSNEDYYNEECIEEDKYPDYDDIEKEKKSKNINWSQIEKGKKKKDGKSIYKSKVTFRDVVLSKNGISSLSRKIGIVLSSICFLAILVFALMTITRLEIISNGRVGSKAVKLLYDFNNIGELEDNLVGLKSMMTDRCYYSTTVVNSDKSLNTYLKLKKAKTTVNIIESKPGFVLYSLDNPNITPSRLFIFSYKLNLFGKIEEVREFEAIDFYSTSDKVIDEEELDKYIEQWESEH